ncbi:MAG: succinate dehydrogenase / fumarate reductase, iron-sulfur subunit [Solirubrobacteraceae bacterium]|jgi:succinate dehydrogenase / fumarate reductase iron-sulfur subunit|nr:succinate dehydrogenase / fumarate reductase, iron-sulfur subunit [Solirubrobacteraceae bacterium]
MPEYNLKIRRYSPETGEAAYWEEFQIELDGHRSVLDGILQAKDRFDGSIGIRCSCRAAICGSCGVRINGKPGLACHMHLDEAEETSGNGGTITIEPMGNMPVIKDLITDMDAVHWKKIRRVTPWLLPAGDPPEREYIVPKQSMVDVTQTMACIQCGACVSDCLSMEIDPEFIGPAALAKAYRFVGDPRDGQHKERLNDLSQDPHGIYDCTHCFNCIEACPKGVAPMSQIMRLRRIAGSDHGIVDVNNGHRHEQAFVTLVKNNGLLHEAELLPRSYGGDSWFGKFAPKAGLELVDSIPVILKGLARRKMTLKATLVPHKITDHKNLRRIFDTIEAKDERFELNLYIVQPDEEEGERSDSSGTDQQGTPASSSAEDSPNKSADLEAQNQ